MRTTLSVVTLLLALASPAMAQTTEPAPTTPAPVVEQPAPPPVVQQPTPAPMVVQQPAPMVVQQPAPQPAPTVYVAPGYGAYDGSFRGARPPERVQTGTRTEMQNDRGLWGAGVGLFVAGYVLELALTPIANAISHDRTDSVEQDAWAWSLLPFVGPIVQLGIGAPHPAIPITTDLLQIGGLVLFIMGMTSQHEVQVPVYALGDPNDPTTPRLALDLTPTSGGAHATATLTF